MILLEIFYPILRVSSTSKAVLKNQPSLENNGWMLELLIAMHFSSKNEKSALRERSDFNNLL